MCFSTEDSDVYESLWTNSQDVAQQTLALPFLQHMQSGDLQADEYVNFMIQDINYLLKVTDMLRQMSEKVKEEDIKKFMKSRFESYKKFAEMMLKQFNLNVRKRPTADSFKCCKCEERLFSTKQSCFMKGK